MPMWLHPSPKRSRPSLENNGVLMLVRKTQLFVLSMAWRLLEQFYKSTWLTVWDTWCTTRAQPTQTCGLIPKLALTAIATTPKSCSMSTTSLSFIKMIWPCSTRLTSILNWSLTQLVIPTCILDPSFVIMGLTMVCTHSWLTPPSTLERLLITVWNIWGRIFRGRIVTQAVPKP